MAEINATDAKRIAAVLAPKAADPLLFAPFEIDLAVYRHWLGATSRLLQDQCAHLQNLAECGDPLNMLVYQTEFAEKSLAAGPRRGVDAGTDAACGHLMATGTLPQ
ncbi:hypothetical protein [Shinella sp.]|uniref:hypothetical protein n=1 Tax=Shinella sp. TaxID=1870904 RepID=UPI0028B0A555|nr:hypothetical protein [Shinella sp.]